MNVFIDTSAFFALLDRDDQNHTRAKEAWTALLGSGSLCATSNYVLVETFALLQSRIGISAVRGFQEDMLPVLFIEWVDTEVHNAAVSALLAASKRKLSLVDCSSFEIIRKMSIRSVFAFDPHFSEQGFACLP
ncbi:MAG: type II toxin-antitoxin system VapC family toxin [Nitrospirota bacterium]